MTTLSKIQFIVIAALAAILFYTGCGQGSGSSETVLIPEKKGSFEKQAAVYVPVHDTVFTTIWKTKTVNIPFETKNPVNDSLAQAYVVLKDSLERFELYLDAIQIRSFKNVFDDSLINIVIKGEVQGKLNFVQPNYTIKAQKIQVPRKNHILLGGHVVVDQDLQDLRYSLNASIQNDKGHVTRFGYSSIAGKNYVMFGKDFKIFSYKGKQKQQK